MLSDPEAGWGFHPYTHMQPDGREALVAYLVGGSASYILFQEAPEAHASFGPDGRYLVADALDWPERGQAALLLYEKGSNARRVLVSFAVMEAGRGASAS